MRYAWMLLVGFLVPASAGADSGYYGGQEVARDELIFLGDGKGHVLALRTGRKNAKLFYARGKAPFVRQFKRSYSDNDSRGTVSFSFWSPQSGVSPVFSRNHVAHMRFRHGALKKKDGRWTLRCGRRETPLMQLEGAEVARLRKRAFKPRVHSRRPYMVARDDRAAYYYVDRRVGELGGRDFRLFRGKGGAMNEERLTTVITDDVGEVFVTPTGSLVRNKLKKSMYWSPRKGRVEDVFLLDLAKSDYLIYNTLGVYRGRLGTPCDDL